MYMYDSFLNAHIDILSTNVIHLKNNPVMHILVHFNFCIALT